MFQSVSRSRVFPENPESRVTHGFPEIHVRDGISDMLPQLPL